MYKTIDYNHIKGNIDDMKILRMQHINNFGVTKLVKIIKPAQSEHVSMLL